MNKANPASDSVSSQIPVLWGDQDAYGHVNNSVFFKWFEQGRAELLAHVRCSEFVTTNGIGLILAEVSARFKGQVQYPDTVIISTRIGMAERARLVFEHVVKSAKANKDIATGQSTMVAFDFGTNRLVRLPERLLGLAPALPSTPDSEAH